MAVGEATTLGETTLTIINTEEEEETGIVVGDSSLSNSLFFLIEVSEISCCLFNSTFSQIHEKSFPYLSFSA